jgi:hypothetical protein
MMNYSNEVSPFKDIYLNSELYGGVCRELTDKIIILMFP